MTVTNDINKLRTPEVFKVPEGYFDTLCQRTMQNIDKGEVEVIAAKDTKHSTLLSIRKPLYGLVSVAACVAVIFMAVNILDNNVSNDNTAIAKVDKTEIMSESNARTYEEDVLDYSLVGVQDVYDYLEEDYAN